MNMEGMETTSTLRERVAKALWDDHSPAGYANWDEVSSVHDAFLRSADAVLAVLGLDGDDAAYQRVYNALRVHIDSPTAAAAARDALNAAFTATEEGE